MSIKAGNILNEQELNKVFEDLQKIDDQIIKKELENKIFLSTYKFMISIAKRYIDSCKKFIDFDDLCSLGSYGLFKAIKSFKFDKDAKFITYAATCINNEILMGFKKLNKTSKECYLSDPLKQNKDDDSESTLEDLIGSDVDIIETAIQRDEIKTLNNSIAQNLTEKQGEILRMYYGIGYEKPSTYQEIAKICGHCRTNIRNIVNNSVNIIKKDMTKKDKLDDFSQ